MRYLFDLAVMLVFTGLFFSCSLFFGPPDSSGEIQDEMNNSYVVWLDAPSFFENGILRVVAEDFTSSEESRTQEKFKQELQRKLKQSSEGSMAIRGQDYLIATGIDWYGTPIAGKARLVFEGQAFSPQARYALSESGLQSVLVRFFLPVLGDFTSFETLELTTSARNLHSPGGEALPEHLVLGPETFNVKDDGRLSTENYFRIQTVNGQARIDLMFPVSHMPYHFISTRAGLLPTPRLSTYSQGQISPVFLLVNAFGIPPITMGHVTLPQPTGDLEWRFFDQEGSLLTEYVLLAEHAQFIRDIFFPAGYIPSSVPVSSRFLNKSVFFEDYDGSQEGSSTVSNVHTWQKGHFLYQATKKLSRYEYGTEGSYRVAKVYRTRYGGSSRECTTTLKVAGLLTESDPTDDEIIIEMQRCDLGIDTWTEDLDAFDTALLVPAIGGVSYGMKKGHVYWNNIQEQYLSEVFYTDQDVHRLHLRYDWFIGSKEQMILDLWMRFLRGHKVALEYPLGAGIVEYPHNTYEFMGLTLVFYRGRDGLLDSQMRQTKREALWIYDEMPKLLSHLNAYPIP